MKRISPETKERYWALRRGGLSQAQAARECVISKASAHDLDYHLPAGVYNTAQLRRRMQEAPDPIPFDELKPEPRRALEDFGHFCTRYLARDVVPWRTMVSEVLLESLDDPAKVYLLLLGPSGFGKTTVLLDLLAWSIVRDRGLRVMVGSEVLDRAVERLMWVRRLLESSRPFFDAVTGQEAEGVLAHDYGRFKPLDPELWRQDQFTVEQFDGADPSQKEPTVQAASYRSGFQGGRVDLALWDDVATDRNLGDPDLFPWLKNQAERRLEPGGVFLLPGTRLAAGDVFEDCLERTYAADDGEERPFYRTIVLPAHRDELCDGDHRQWDAREDGCLLDEKRLPWSELLKHQADSDYQTIFQQAPELAASTLVSPVWISGGVDANGFEAPGCLDHDREWGEHPKVEGRLVDYVNVDPAVSTGWFVVEHWAVDPQTRVRYLIEAWRKQMGLAEFVDFDPQTGVLTGLAEAIQSRSEGSGHPIKVWIIESNVGGDLRAFRSFRAWMVKHPRVTFIATRTQGNKTDQQFGVEAVLPGPYRAGLKRLPYKGVEARNYLKVKIGELTRYPHVRLSDTVMADWFGESNLDQIIQAGQVRPAAVQLPPGYAHLKRRQREVPIVRREALDALFPGAKGQIDPRVLARARINEKGQLVPAGSDWHEFLLRDASGNPV